MRGGVVIYTNNVEDFTNIYITDTKNTQTPNNKL